MERINAQSELKVNRNSPKNQRGPEMSSPYNKEKKRLRRILREIKKREAELKANIKSLRRDSDEISILKGNPFGQKRLPRFFQLREK